MPVSWILSHKHFSLPDYEHVTVGTQRHNAVALPSVPERNTWRLKVCGAAEAETETETDLPLQTDI